MKKIAIVFLTAVVLYSACDVVNSQRVKGDGNMTSETVQVGDFTGVELHSSFEVYLTQGNSVAVKIDAEQNIRSYIDVHVENGILNIDTKENNVWLDPTQPVKIFVTAPTFSRIQNHGSGSITGQNKITHDSKLDIYSSGSGASKLDVDAPEISAGVSGSGGMTLAGETKKFSADVSGSGSLKAMNLMTEESTVQTSGSGSVDVYASVKLGANISGSGSINYKGDAQVTSNRSGSGNVNKVD